jgi:hypothetical protein
VFSSQRTKIPSWYENVSLMLSQRAKSLLNHSPDESASPSWVLVALMTSHTRGTTV